MDTASFIAPVVTLVIGIFARELAGLARKIGGVWISHRSTANDLIFPLVRVSDELVGRMYHQIRSDFKSHVARADDVAHITNHDHLYDVYLWARFWAHTSEIRRNILSYDLSKTDNGRELLRFIDCLEASKASITPRSYQKFVGDGFCDQIGLKNGGSYHEFARWIQEDPYFSQTMDGVNGLLYGAQLSKAQRHKIIKYVIIIHAMNDRLDRSRRVSSERKSMAHKLDRKSRTDLRMRILRRYLGLSEREIAFYS